MTARQRQQKKSILIGPRSPLNLQGIGLLHDNSCLMLILGEATHYAQLMDLQEWSCQHLIDKQIQGKILHAHQRLMLFYELVLISLGCTVLGWSTPVQFFCLPNKLTNTKPVECCNVQIKQYGLCSLLSRKTIWNTCGNIPKHALTMMIFFF